MKLPANHSIHQHTNIDAYPHVHTHTTTGACLFLVFNWFSFLIQTQPKSGPVKRRILHSCAKARPYIQTGRFEASHKIRYPVVFVPNFCNRHMSDWHLGSNLMCIFSSVCATKNTGIAQFRSFFFRELVSRCADAIARHGRKRQI